MKKLTVLLSIIPSLLVLSVAANEMPSLEEFAMRPIVRDVDLSPSGEHLAVMRLAGRGLNYVVDVYETEHMDRDPHTLGSEHMDIVGVNWANDKTLADPHAATGGGAGAAHWLQFGGHRRARQGKDLCLETAVRGD